MYLFQWLAPDPILSEDVYIIFEIHSDEIDFPFEILQ